MLWVSAPAKVNLFLEITGQRADGYHDLRMLLQTISLWDRIGLMAIAGELEVVCNHPQVPTDESNLAVRAVRLLQQECPGRVGGVRLIIEKHIPVGGGLAGGSTNGAAVLWGLNQLWQLGLSPSQLHALALQLGSDVPFCLQGGTAIAKGRGEILTPVTNFPSCDLVIAQPRGVSVSTAWAYKTFRAQRLIHQKIADTELLWQGLLSASDPQAVSQYLYNDLERVVVAEIKAIAELRQQLLDLGCLGSLMSGSGACVFGICQSAEQAESIKARLPRDRVASWVVTTGYHTLCI